MIQHRRRIFWMEVVLCHLARKYLVERDLRTLSPAS